MTGMTQGDTADGEGQGGIEAASAVELSSSPTNGREEAIANPMHGMAMDATNVRAGRARRSQPMPAVSRSQPSMLGSTQLNGCLTFLSDGRVMLKALPSAKTYRMEGTLFSLNANHLVQVSGYFSSVVAVEDPGIPSFVVKTVDELASNCSAKVTPALLRKALAKAAGGGTGTLGPLTVGMSDMAFMPPKIVIKVGQKVTWKDSSEVIHNVVDDTGKAINQADVHVPEDGKAFDSECVPFWPEAFFPSV